nr:hypothetical protein Iba_chr06aCG9090 [Ipomoea batatas]GMD05751.1 hypothetical protein Iba_chr06bCG9440 [Ipomoea batatas]GMD07291.1 hypothetical protein Iba_chr06cCG5780 [Ipomoea batatas]GMD10685.1 hypothetical protein Iba_chr06eCG8620 [Ipomoea batatas]GMD12053.1 hypothetical protein Iba_chr06fCG9470 [Ipomoea batatas]
MPNNPFSHVTYSLFWLTILTTNSCHYYVTCLSPITINNCCFHLIIPDFHVIHLLRQTINTNSVTTGFSHTRSRW